jgi:hypothetical protein
MKYLAYCPIDMTYFEALALASPHLSENAICNVLKHRVEVVPVKGEPKCISYDTHLVAIRPDGTHDVIDKKGFN